MANTVKTNNQGFTLIEMIVVIILIITIGSMIGVIISTSLQGTNKTNNETLVRQSGSFALNQMSKMIRGGLFVGTDAGVSVDGTAGSFSTSCQSFPPGITPAPTLEQFHYIRITSSTDNGQTLFTCNSPATLSSTSASLTQSLIDTNNITIPAGKCYFTCTQEQPGQPPFVGIYFQLGLKSSVSSFIEQVITPIDFQTTVSMRNSQ